MHIRNDEIMEYDVYMKCNRGNYKLYEAQKNKSMYKTVLAGRSEKCEDTQCIFYESVREKVKEARGLVSECKSSW